MFNAAKGAMNYCDTLPNSDYVIHEASPNCARHGKAAGAGWNSAVPWRQCKFHRRAGFSPHGI